MAKNPGDLRIVKTDKAIEEAFFALMDQMSYDKLTVKDICSAAMVGTATFYSHYSDKNALAKHLARKFLAELRSAILWNLSMMDSGLSVDEAWSRLASVRTGLYMKRRVLSGISISGYDFRAEMLAMFRELIVDRNPNEDLPEEEYARQSVIAARLLYDYYSYVEETDDFLPLTDYLAKGMNILEGYRGGARVAAEEENAPDHVDTYFIE